MRVQVCINNYTYVWGQHIPLNAWYGRDDESCFFCTAHKPSDDFSLDLYRFNGIRWNKVHEISHTTHIIYAWASRHNLWWTKCHWFHEEDRKHKRIANYADHLDDIANMMKHDRKHKRSGSGIRLDKENFYADKTFTDYECRKNPMHDFPRY